MTFLMNNTLYTSISPDKRQNSGSIEKQGLQLSAPLMTKLTKLRFAFHADGNQQGIGCRLIILIPVMDPFMGSKNTKA